MAVQDFERRIVDVRMQPKCMPAREFHRAPDDVARGRLATQMELANADVIAASILLLEQFQYGRVAEPALHIVAHAVRAEEWHDPDAPRTACLLHKRVRPIVRATRREDRRDAVGTHQRERFVNRKAETAFPVQMQMRVEQAAVVTNDALGAGGHRQQAKHRVREEANLAHLTFEVRAPIVPWPRCNRSTMPRSNRFKPSAIGE